MNDYNDNSAEEYFSEENYSEEKYSEENYSEENYLEEDYPEEDYPEGDYPEGSFPDEELSGRDGSGRITAGLVNAVKAILFTAILGVVFFFTFKVLWVTEDTDIDMVMKSFYDLPDHTADALYFGSSAVRDYYIAPEGYQHSGIAVYPLGIYNQPFGAIENMIIEAKKTQDPKLLLIDVRCIADENIEDPFIRLTTDTMKFSRNRTALIDKMIRVYSEIEPEAEPLNRIHMLFSFFLYHQRWEDVTGKDFEPSVTVMGYYPRWVIDDQTDIDYGLATISEDRAEIPFYNEQALRELLAFCDTLDEEVLFTLTPGYFNPLDQQRVNSAVDIIREAGYEFWDMREDIYAMGLDPASDYRNNDHVNTPGAIKFTDYTADVLKDRYALPDHRGEAAYAVWDEAVSAFEKMCEDPVWEED